MLSVAILLAVSAPTILNGSPVEKAWSVLNDAITNKVADQRSEGIQALGSIEGNRKADELAEKALQDPDADVRASGATTIGQMKDLRARPLLHKALQDDDVRVVLAAANSLYIFKDPAAYEVYYAVVTGQRKPGPSFIKGQLETLKNRKDLEKLAFETGIGFVPYAGIGWGVWQRLSSDHGSSIRAAAVEKLATDHDAKSTEALIQVSDDNDWRVRAAVANAIGRRGDPKLLGTVSSMLLDSNQSVRLQAAAAVVNLTGRKRSK